MGGFLDRIARACAANRSLLCVGLDPDPRLMPAPDALAFNRAIVDATAEAVCAYKPNLAFYEALGAAGLTALAGTVAYIRERAGNALIIGDAKRGDVGPAAAAYAKAMFGVWGFDAVTVNPWGGADAVAPFLEDASRGVFVWCRGSNPGSGDFQDLATGPGLPTRDAGASMDAGALMDAGASVDAGALMDAGASLPLYARVARACVGWNSRGNVGLVAGATAPEQLAAVRRLCPDLPLLVPGVGAQGGDLAAAVRAGTDAAGRLAIINSSRGIIYASSGPGYAAAAGDAARRLRDAINATLDEDGRGWPLS